MKKIRPLCIMLLKITEYVKYFGCKINVNFHNGVSKGGPHCICFW